MASNMEFPLRFKRQYAEPLDADTYATTIAELDDIKTRSNSYPGMLVSCKEDGNVYKLGLDGEFVVLGSGGDANITYMTVSELDTMWGTTEILPYTEV